MVSIESVTFLLLPSLGCGLIADVRTHAFHSISLYCKNAFRCYEDFRLSLTAFALLNLKVVFNNISASVFKRSTVIDFLRLSNNSS